MKIYNPQLSYSNDEIVNIIAQDKVSKRILEKNYTLSENDIVGVRLNLNVLKNTGVPVQTIHKGKENNKYEGNKGLFDGEAISYKEAVYLKEAFFNVNQKARQYIASGEKNKYAMASIDGKYMDCNIPSGFSGIEIKFNPKKHHLFVDENNQAIQYAEEVIVIGHRAFACGTIIYHSQETSPKKVGDYPSETLIKSEGLVFEIPKQHILSKKIGNAI